MSCSFQKGEFDRFFKRLDRPVEESRPDRQPDRPATGPVSISDLLANVVCSKFLLGTCIFRTAKKNIARTMQLYTVPY